MTEKTDKVEKKAAKPKKPEVGAKKKIEPKEASEPAHVHAPKEEKAAEKPVAPAIPVHVHAPKEEKVETVVKAAEKPVASAIPEGKVAPHAAAKAHKPKKAARKAKGKVIVARGKRKTAVARATIKPGKGVIRFNRVLLDAYNNKYIREIIREPVRYVGPEVNSVDISVNVFGGGSMGQAQAARTAIANALVQYFEGMNLKEKFMSIDRSLIIEDTRRVETKKYRGPKARARYQKSYR